MREKILYRGEGVIALNKHYRKTMSCFRYPSGTGWLTEKWHLSKVCATKQKASRKCDSSTNARNVEMVIDDPILVAKHLWFPVLPRCGVKSSPPMLQGDCALAQKKSRPRSLWSIAEPPWHGTRREYCCYTFNHAEHRYFSPNLSNFTNFYRFLAEFPQFFRAA